MVLCIAEAHMHAKKKIPLRQKSLEDPLTQRNVQSDLEKKHEKKTSEKCVGLDTPRTKIVSVFGKKKG